MKNLRQKIYQYQADKIITLIETAPKDMVGYLFAMGMNLNKKAIDKGIWLE